MKAHYVQYHLTGTGYRVTAYDAESQPVEEYEAGNHPGDSQAVARPGEPRVRAQTLKKWARQTALDMAKEHGVDPSKVSYDHDGETAARDMLEEIKRGR